MFYNILIFIFTIVIVSEFSKAGRRIFQGQDVAFGEFPYIASLVELKGNPSKEKINSYSHICTCSVLTPKWTLSAAHCMDKPPVLTPTYIAYQARLEDNRLFVKATAVLEAIPHPNYDFDLASMETDSFSRFKFDICLLRTRRINIEHYAVLSAVDYKTLIGHEVLVFGYGATNISSTVYVALKLKKPLQMYKGMVSPCPKAYESFMAICISSPCGSLAMICGGDSGGPVIHTSGILGVNSFTYNDCENARNLRDIHKHSLAHATSSTLTPLSSSVDWISRILSSTPAI